MLNEKQSPQADKIPEKTPNNKDFKLQQQRWHYHFWRYLVSHFSACRTSLRNLSLTPIATLMTITAIGMCLALPMGLYLFIKNIQHISHGWDQGSAITLYVHPKSTSQQIDAIVEKIKAFPGVSTISYLTPENALAEFQQASGLNDVLSLLPENPLPAVISIHVNTKEVPKSALMEMKQALEKQSQVKKAALDYEWVEKLNSFLLFGKTLIEFLCVIIGVGVILIVANTIRLVLERHRDEIEVLTLVGATVAYIRRPFLYRGVLFGSLGGIIAALLVTLVVMALEPHAQYISSLYHGIFSLENLRFYDTLGLLVASAGLGWLGAALAFRQQHRAMTAQSLKL